MALNFLHFERGKVMKKILSITLGLVMILSMCSALMFSASAAADARAGAPSTLRKDRAPDTRAP